MIISEQTVIIPRETPVYERIVIACKEASQTPEYQKAKAEVNRIWNELTAKLELDSRSLLIKFEAAMLDFCDIEARACYIKGVRDEKGDVA
jgi:hypothetical protein